MAVLGLMLVTAVVTVGVTIFIFKTYLFPSEFRPVVLKPAEEKELALKLEKIDPTGSVLILPQKKDPGRRLERDRYDSSVPLEPEAYSETGAKREIEFTERELNGLLAKNTDLASKVAIDLSDNLISARILLPVDEDFPVLGGKLLRLKSGLVFSYSHGKPVVILKGITVMGVPVPNAWLGGIKNIDLVERFDKEKGFWKTFADGVEDIKVEEGRLKIKLKE
ncbi:MAG: arginine N-succinyltransferase [Desulfuromonadaceae bacterium]|nr:arginine N-succinyltransferase [Desulfuromonadaceae bacterium]